MVVQGFSCSAGSDDSSRPAEHEQVQLARRPEKAKVAAQNAPMPTAVASNTSRT
jgi:hypothetical protein